MNTHRPDDQNELLYSYLTSLGNIYGLEIFFDWNVLEPELEPFMTDWKHYNPRKKQIPRYGLSLTSLDGHLSGIPDLDSIAEYNRQNKTNLGEESFNTHTPVLKNVSSLNKPLSPFLPYLGRSHLLRLNEGGYFPFHRDSQWFNAPTFRLISLLNCDSNSFCFIYDDQRIFLNPSQLYFMNTRMSHALFSFVDGATVLVLNVILSTNSAEEVRKNLIAK